MKDENLKKIDKEDKLKIYGLNKLYEYGIYYIGENPIAFFGTERIIKIYNRIFKKDMTKDFENRINVEKISLVYFIGSLEHGLLKIGVTKYLKGRFQTIQVSCPFKVEILKTQFGDSKKEAEIKKKFSKLNTIGEWFRIEGELKDLLDSGLRKAV